MSDVTTWQQAYAPAWAATLPDVLGRTYPYAAQHTTRGPQDCDVTPDRLHPAFHGCFDWHSACHMLWSSIQLLTHAPEEIGEDSANALADLLDQRLSPDNIRVEMDYLRANPLFERPYGWGWAALLARAAADCPDPRAADWAEATAPLHDVVLELFAEWLPRLRYPVRSGEHANIAFALGLAWDSVDGSESAVAGQIREVIEERARFWFGSDRDYPAAWEPGGSDFLSPALAEADLMRRVMPAAEFTDWLAAFLPGLDDASHPLRQAPEVVDPTDGKGAHLLGLTLSRAAALRAVSVALDPDVRAVIREETGTHIRSVAQQIVDGDFMATHWLVSFAILAEAS